jgi:hypothetical protein
MGADDEFSPCTTGLRCLNVCTATKRHTAIWVTGMNLEQLKKKGPGSRIKLVPPACHLDAAGEPLPVRDEDWVVMAVTDQYVEIATDSGCFCRLGNDHIKNFATDPQRSVDGLNHGFLLLLVQIYVEGSDVKAIPTSRPGESMTPPINHALKARATFIPELERVFRRQVQILDRVLANFTTTANEFLGRQYPVRPNDTWESLRPTLPHLFPDSAPYRDLSASDAELLAEFYGAVREVTDLVDHWAGTVALTEYNAWNVLMHKVQHSLQMGELAVRKLCPDRAYDATMPASGTLLSRSQTALTATEKARGLYLEKFTAFFREKEAQLKQPPRGRAGTR